MAEFPDERQLVLGARSQLDRWTKSARERRTLNCSTATILFSPKRCNCSMRSTRNWSDRAAMVSGGTDQYGIHTTGTSSSNTSLGVVCVYHPQITTDSVLRGGDDLDDETEEGSTPRSGNTASTSRHSSKHNPTNSFIKTSGTPIRSLSVIERIYRSGLFGDRCHVPRGFVLIFFRVSTLNISGTL